MSLATGARLGTHEIVGPLGAGVWARSTVRATRASNGTSRSTCCPLTVIGAAQAAGLEPPEINAILALELLPT